MQQSSPILCRANFYSAQFFRSREARIFKVGFAERQRASPLQFAQLVKLFSLVTILTSHLGRFQRKTPSPRPPRCPNVRMRPTEGSIDLRRLVSVPVVLAGYSRVTSASLGLMGNNPIIHYERWCCQESNTSGRLDETVIVSAADGPSTESSSSAL